MTKLCRNCGRGNCRKKGDIEALCFAHGFDFVPMGCVWIEDERPL